jgi:hypothetical protein
MNREKKKKIQSKRELLVAEAKDRGEKSSYLFLQLMEPIA